MTKLQVSGWVLEFRAITRRNLKWVAGVFGYRRFAAEVEETDERIVGLEDLVRRFLNVTPELWEDESHLEGDDARQRTVRRSDQRERQE